MNQHRLLGEMDGKLPRTYLFIDEAKQLQEIFEPEKIAQENQTKPRKLEKSADIETSLAKLQEAKVASVFLYYYISVFL